MPREPGPGRFSLKSQAIFLFFSRPGQKSALEAIFSYCATEAQSISYLEGIDAYLALGGDVGGGRLWPDSNSGPAGIPSVDNAVLYA